MRMSFVLNLLFAFFFVCKFFKIINALQKDGMGNRKNGCFEIKNIYIFLRSNFSSLFDLNRAV